MEYLVHYQYSTVLTKRERRILSHLVVMDRGKINPLRYTDTNLDLYSTLVFNTHTVKV